MKSTKSRCVALNRQPNCKKGERQTSELSVSASKSLVAASKKRRNDPQSADAKSIKGKAILYTKDYPRSRTLPIRAISSTRITANRVRLTYLLKDFAVDFDVLRPPHVLIQDAGLPVYADDSFFTLADDPPDGFVFVDYHWLGYPRAFTDGFDGTGKLITHDGHNVVVARFCIREGRKLLPDEQTLISRGRHYVAGGKNIAVDSEKNRGPLPCNTCGWIHNDEFEYMINPKSLARYFLTGKHARHHVAKLHESRKRKELGLRNKLLYEASHPFGECRHISEDFRGEKMEGAYEALIDTKTVNGRLLLKRPE